MPDAGMGAINVGQPATAAGVLLAAGMSRRVGQLKQTLDWSGKSILRHTATTLLDAGLTPVLVVLGHERERLTDELYGLDVVVVKNADYHKGMFSSVQAGLSALPGNVSRCAICLVDQPGIEPDVIRRLVRVSNEHSAAVVIPRHQGQTGHPVIVTREVIQASLAAEPAATLRDVLAGFANRTRYVDVETDSVVCDIDTLDDYEQQRPRRSGRHGDAKT